MTIGTVLIERSLEKIKAHSEVNPAPPEAIVSCMFELNAMLQEWESQGIEMGIVPIETPAEDVGEPPDATLAIINCFAIQVAPDFADGKPNVTPELRANANSTYEKLRTARQKVVIAQKGVSSLMPMGQGNKYGGTFTNSRIFAGKDAKVDG